MKKTTPSDPSVTQKPAAEEPNRTAIAEHPRVPRFRKLSSLWFVTRIISLLQHFNLLLRTMVVLLIVISLVIGLRPYAASQYHPHSALPTPVPIVTVIPTPSPTPPPALVGSYNGTIYNIPMNIATAMFLTKVQLSQGTVRGYFTGLHVSGSFKGSINASTRHILFTVTDHAGNAALSFDGSVQPNNAVSGSYCNLNVYSRCAGEYGIWSIAPAS